MNDSAAIQLDFLPDDPAGIYLVGGALRDLLTGHAPADIDLVVAGDIFRTAGQIAAKTGGRIIDLGKKGFDTLRITSPQTTIDITPLNHPSIEADLLQRDFTVNAMAFDVNARRLVDCTGGLVDLRQKRIRMVSPGIFASDPARLVRAYRMAAVFHYSISSGTREAIGRHCHLVDRVAGERVRDELVKLFNCNASASTIRAMAASGLLTALFPELQPAIGCVQNHHHEFDVFAHSLLVYEKLEALLGGSDDAFFDLAAVADPADLRGHAAMLKYAALLHDVGKPATRQVDSRGRVAFPGHAATSAAIAARISSRLRLSNRQREVADAVIRHHIRPLFLYLASENGSLGRRGWVRFFNRCDRLTLPIIVHAMADIMAKAKVLKGRDRDFISFCERLVSEYREFRHRRITVPRLISGHDLMAMFGLPPSPRFKHILNRVDERRLSGELETREEALEWVGAFLSSEANARKPEG